MPSLSEFVSFVAEKSKVKNLSLVEKDIILHRILKEISSRLPNNYLFKGGSCLVKGYFGYYRFSVDLDFTWRDQEVRKRLGGKRLRRELLNEIKAFSFLLKEVSESTGLKFEVGLGNRNFIEFGGGGRMVTFKLWKDSELVKIQVNFIEELLFPPKEVKVRTLLDEVKLSKNEEVYFEDFLNFYKPFKVKAYDEREILCEKVRAILTRRTQKLRDFYDLFILSQNGFEVKDLEEEAIRKIKTALHYKKYRDSLEKNKGDLKVTGEVLEDPFERNLLITKPQKNFENFLKTLTEVLREIAIKT